MIDADVHQGQSLPSSVGQEDEVHGRGGRQVGRSADEHSGAQSREGQEQTRNVGSDFAQDALEARLDFTKASAELQVFAATGCHQDS